MSGGGSNVSTPSSSGGGGIVEEGEPADLADCALNSPQVRQLPQTDNLSPPSAEQSVRSEKSLNESIEQGCEAEDLLEESKTVGRGGGNGDGGASSNGIELDELKKLVFHGENTITHPLE